jgi:hypothetical protein
VSISQSENFLLRPVSRSAPSPITHAPPPKQAPSKPALRTQFLSPPLHTPRLAVPLITSPSGSSPHPRRPKSAPSTQTSRGYKPLLHQYTAPTSTVTVPTAALCSTLYQATTLLCLAQIMATGISRNMLRLVRMMIMTRQAVFCMR